MSPWERRLRDLAQLLRNCGETYFSPDRFRQNTNQFLQTSRTVTFIIQKNKEAIPDFDTWYKINVLQPWASDSVMTWAKDSRNVIEKEGDLEMRSTLEVAVLYSYYDDENMVLEVTRKELLQASIEQLIKAADRKLPPGIADAAVLKIRRRWVANTLPDHELIYAFTYVYSQLYLVCSVLAKHLDFELDRSVPHPTSMDPSSNDIARTRFMKLNKPGVGRFVSKKLDADQSFKPPEAVLKLKEEFQSSPKPTSLKGIVARQARMAQVTFEQYGNHIPMLALYDKNWNHIDFISTAFTDQAEKFLFWRNVADRAFYLRAYAMVWTSESWLRNMRDHQDRPISKLPIVGEHLAVVGVDATGKHEVVEWNITRPDHPDHPVLTLLPPDDTDQLRDIFFIKPIVAAMKMAHAQ
ncbi:hypothetical protein [Castellaniella sp.]|uniref:hypothetical protein n=1 Tax=Castellaniella sp. TaxID=1955812 RepID=UPI003C774181